MSSGTDDPFGSPDNERTRFIPSPGGRQASQTRLVEPSDLEAVPRAYQHEGVSRAGLNPLVAIRLASGLPTSDLA